MRITKLIVTALVITGVATAAMPAFAAQGGTLRTPSAAAASLTELSDAEIAMLQWMREEEKLARDVYLAFGAKYPEKIFTNIAASEQKHFDAIGRKLELYGVDDPASDQVGVFTNQDLQVLYYDLLGMGEAGYIEALQVGVLIEETDLTDLEIAIDGTDSVPLARTYEHLLTGSEHHLAAFTRLLAKAGVVVE
jgi:hypothetical protein